VCAYLHPPGFRCRSMTSARLLLRAGLGLLALMLPAGAIARPSDAPPNGTFASAQLISGSAGSVGGSNVGAGLEAGDGPIAGNGGGARVWYRWTAPASGSASVDTHGSSFDTLLGVFTGSSLSSLSSVGQSDDTTGSDKTSVVAFQATAGTTYQIAVDGYRGPSSGQAQGSIVLNWWEKSPPPH